MASVNSRGRLQLTTVLLNAICLNAITAIAFFGARVRKFEAPESLLFGFFKIRLP